MDSKRIKEGIVIGTFTALLLLVLSWLLGGIKVQVNKNQEIKLVKDLIGEDEFVSSVIDGLQNEGIVLPVGTVVAWPGKQTSSVLDSDYWHQCDGSSIPYNEDLWNALEGLYGNTKPNNEEPDIVLPNFQSRFLRGAGEPAEAVGTPQSWATGMPKDSPFATHNDGGHAHKMGSSASDGSYHSGSLQGNSTGLGVREGSEHHHIITGGDAETRPDNYAVVWLIRIK